MGGDVAEIAARLRAVAEDRGRSQQLLASLFATSVELRHDPPHPSDGPVAGALLAEISRREVEAADRALVDLRSESDVDVESNDGIRLRVRTTGAFADGRTVDVQIHTRLTVADGSVVALQADMDDAAMAAWGEVLVAGGFEIPDGGLQ
jgi:hypothetical protein